MKQNTKIILTSILVIFIVIGIYIASYSYSISKVELKNVNVDELQGVSAKGFTLGGKLEVYNGGIVTIDVVAIDYNITLEKNDLLLSKGKIDGNKIKPKTVQIFKFSNDIDWVPTVDLVKNLIQEDNVYVNVKGNIKLKGLDLFEATIPFEQKTDIKPYVMQFYQEKVTGLIDRAKDFLESDIAQNLIEKTKGYIG